MDSTACLCVFLSAVVLTVRAYGAEIQIEAMGLLHQICEPGFLFSARLVHSVLALSDPPNKVLQREDTDLLAGLNIVARAKACVQELRCDEECDKARDMAPNP